MFTFGSSASKGPSPFSFSQTRHRRMPLQAHEVTPSLLSGAIILHLLLLRVL